MTAYYNEHDPFAAAWLRELIKAGLIAPGEVDTRDIEDVTPDDVRSFRQCHFFAGIGVWSLAARRVGIPDDAPLWTGSCPCQPFSTAGKGEGFDDKRHVWPAFHYLAEQCEPPIIVGEQVTGADGDAWLDLVSADMDASGYAFGAAETVAAGFGAPHKRSRNYWVAYLLGAGLEGFRRYVPRPQGSGWLREIEARSTPARRLLDQLAHGESSRWREERPLIGRLAFGDRTEGDAARSRDGRGARQLADPVDHGQRQHGGRLGRAPETAEGGAEQWERVRPDPSHGEPIVGMADADGERGDGRGAAVGREARSSTGDARTGAAGRLADAERNGGRPDQPLGRAEERIAHGRAGAVGGLVNADGERWGREGLHPGQGGSGSTAVDEWGTAQGSRRNSTPGPVNGLWGDADWLRCRDEKWRAVEPGTFPLADAGAFRNRVGLLRGAGNAITLGQAEGFLAAVIAAMP